MRAPRDPDELLLTAEEVARRLSLDRATLCRMRSATTLPTMRLGQIVRVPARALDRWVERKTAEIELLDTRAIPEAKEVV